MKKAKKSTDSHSKKVDMNKRKMNEFTIRKRRKEKRHIKIKGNKRTKWRKYDIKNVRNGREHKEEHRKNSIFNVVPRKRKRQKYEDHRNKAKQHRKSSSREKRVRAGIRFYFVQNLCTCLSAECRLCIKFLSVVSCFEHIISFVVDWISVGKRMNEHIDIVNSEHITPSKNVLFFVHCSNVVSSVYTKNTWKW